MAAQPKFKTTGQKISRSIFYIGTQTIAVQTPFPTKQPIRIESFNIKDPLDTDDDEDKTIHELHKEIQATVESNMKDTKINSFIWSITGVAGSGKTQYALKYIYKYKHEYDHCYLMNASTAQNANKSFLDIESDLKLNGITILKKGASVENVYNGTLTKRCLIVFDAIDCGTNFVKTDYGKFFPPTLKTGWKQPVIIVTSKNRDWELHKIVKVRGNHGVRRYP
ncbi:unnamed protein product [Allacma fusca]|uniref:NB-ARC domain-containing protein n=1 Tax=Allacma fusca TaxID=39272 RepID=A0A8J2JGP7_9HEXA|nr:unnamed protein product [Allacma fusca]